MELNTKQERDYYPKETKPKRDYKKNRKKDFLPGLDDLQTRRLLGTGVIGAQPQSLDEQLRQEDFGVVEAVRSRLEQWADYHEHRSVSQPSPAYSIADKVADEIFRIRRPRPSIRTPDPKLDLNVSHETVMETYKRFVGE